MKVIKKQGNSKNNDSFTDFDAKIKCFIKDNEFEDLSDKQDTFNNVEQLDIMDLSVSNFHFSNFNKIGLEGLDIISEEDTIAKDDLFDAVVGDLVDDHKNSGDTKSLDELIPKGVEDIYNTDQRDISQNCFEKELPKLSKRALKRKKRLEESKLQCPVRTTARHYKKMFEYFEANPGLATGQLPKIIYRKKWRELTEILNQQGIGEKSTEKWQKTWSDYKLHLRKKVSGIKRSGKALNVPNQFTEQDKRALSNIGVSLCDEDITKNAIKKRFNPDTLELEDSSSHTNVPSSTLQLNIPTSTQDVFPPRKQDIKHVMQQRRRKFTERHLKMKTFEYQRETLRQLRSLRTTISDGFSRIGDILERLVRNSESGTSVASNLSEAATNIAATANNFLNVFDTKRSNSGN